MTLLERLLAHDAWATDRLLAACTDLPEADWTRAFEIGPGSLERTFAHLVGARRRWAARLADAPPAPSIEERERWTVAALRAENAAAAAAFAAAVAAVEAADAGDAPMTVTLDGRDWTFTRATAVAHVILHGQHHRAQILNMLRRLGAAPGIDGDPIEWELAERALGDARNAAPAYVLGTGDDELRRLAFQHRLWADAAHAAWRRARIAPGRRVLDIGCGPGHAAFDLAGLVTARGAVVGVDESAPFVAHANAQARLRDLPQLRAVTGDVQALPAVLADEAPFDLAYARWVLCFVRDPEAVIAGAAACLAPGGRLVLHDYFNYGSMTPSPRSRAHDAAVAATMRSWRARGGDPDVMGRVPEMLARHGLRLVEHHAHVRIARPGDTMFAWPDTWWRIYAPKLVAMGELDPRDAETLLAELDAMQANPDAGAFFQCPPVHEMIGVKEG